MRAPAEAPYAALAQLVEHRIRNAGVVGSNPIGGTIFLFISATCKPRACGALLYILPSKHA